MYGHWNESYLPATKMGEAKLKSARRLDSWKEIAAFFGRDERTVRRWEKESALPVHRVPGPAKGRVFAYESELEEWLATPQALGKEHNTEQPIVEKTERQAVPMSASSHVWTAAKWVGGLAALTALVFGVLVYRKNHGWFAVQAAGSSSSSAEDFYLKGRYYWNKRTPADLTTAVDYFTQAIVQDPRYAAAYVGLADSYNLLREYSAMPSSDAFPRARAAAQKAVQYDPNSADAHTSLAFALFWGFVDVAGAESHFKRALELQPNNARAHHWYATYLVELRRFREALAEIERARMLDPSSTPILADKGCILGAAGETEQAIALLKQVEKAEPGFRSPHQYLADIYFSTGRYSDYFEEAKIAANLKHDERFANSLAELQTAYARGGARGLLEAKLQEDLELSGQGLASDFVLAADYALLDEKPEAMRYLESSYQKHDPELTGLLTSSALASLQHEAAFRELVAKVGLPLTN